MPEKPHCPFFGRIALPALQVLTERTGSVNCALETGPYLTPCKMLAANAAPDWEKCGENTGASWKNQMLAWSENTEGQKMLIDFRYPD